MEAPENRSDVGASDVGASDVGAKDFRMATTVLGGIAILAILLEIIS